jgi:hypothetical protein
MLSVRTQAVRQSMPDHMAQYLFAQIIELKQVQPSNIRQHCLIIAPSISGLGRVKPQKSPYMLTVSMEVKAFVVTNIIGKLWSENQLPSIFCNCVKSIF